MIFSLSLVGQHRAGREGYFRLKAELTTTAVNLPGETARLLVWSSGKRHADDSVALKIFHFIHWRWRWVRQHNDFGLLFSSVFAWQLNNKSKITLSWWASHSYVSGSGYRQYRMELWIDFIPSIWRQTTHWEEKPPPVDSVPEYSEMKLPRVALITDDVSI